MALFLAHRRISKPFRAHSVSFQTWAVLSAPAVASHLGKFVVIRHDDITGIYDTPDDAIFEAYKRFGFVPLIVKEIRPEEPADFVSLVDLNHPSLKRIN
jgi:hypothetical protein